MEGAEPSLSCEAVALAGGAAGLPKPTNILYQRLSHTLETSAGAENATSTCGAHTNDIITASTAPNQR